MAHIEYNLCLQPVRVTVRAPEHEFCTPASDMVFVTVAERAGRTKQKGPLLAVRTCRQCRIEVKCVS